MGRTPTAWKKFRQSTRVVEGRRGVSLYSNRSSTITTIGRDTMLNSILIRIAQLVTSLFFTAAVLIYTGAMLLVPLAVLTGIVGLLSAIGFNGIFATLIGVPALLWIGARMHRIDGVTATLVDTGVGLVRMGVDVFRKFDDIARGLKQPADAAASTSTR